MTPAAGAIGGGAAKVVVARTRQAAFEALGQEKRDSHDLVEGSGNLAARIGDTFLVWGVPSSPLALKIAEEILALYRDSPDPPNRFFYACYAGTHSSVTAAALHLDRLRGEAKVADLPLFDRRHFTEAGTPALIGVDDNGAEVYALGTGWLSSQVELPICDLVRVASPRANACVCSVRGFLDTRARVGGFASRRCRMVYLGRALVAASLTRALPKMSKAVDECLDLSLRWADNEGQPVGEVMWVDGRRKGRPRLDSRGRQPSIPPRA